MLTFCRIYFQSSCVCAGDGEGVHFTVNILLWVTASAFLNLILSPVLLT